MPPMRHSMFTPLAPCAFLKSRREFFRSYVYARSFDAIFLPRVKSLASSPRVPIAFAAFSP